MPEERHQPSQSSPPQHTFAQETRKPPSPQQQQRETPTSAPSARTLPQSFLPHLPFWEQPSFQNSVLSTNKLPYSAPQQRRETFSSSPPTQQRALSSRSQQQKLPTIFSRAQPSPSSVPSQKLQYSQGSFSQPKQIRPLPSSKYIHPSPFDEIVQKYSLPKQVISKNGISLSSEEELELIHQQEQEIERKWGATSDPNEKARLEAQVAVLWKRSKEIQFGVGWQPAGFVQPPRGGQVLKALPNGFPPGWGPAMPPPPPPSPSLPIIQEGIYFLIQGLYSLLGEFESFKNNLKRAKDNQVGTRESAFKKLESLGYQVNRTLHSVTKLPTAGILGQRGLQEVNDALDTVIDITLNLENIKTVFNDNKANVEEIIENIRSLLAVLLEFDSMARSRNPIGSVGIGAKSLGDITNAIERLGFLMWQEAWSSK